MAPYRDGDKPFDPHEDDYIRGWRDGEASGKRVALEKIQQMVGEGTEPREIIKVMVEYFAAK